MKTTKKSAAKTSKKVTSSNGKIIIDCNIKGTTIINLTDVSGKEICNHIWLVIGKQIKNLDLNIGDKITFEARSAEYWKGYKGYRDDVYKPIEKDYKLSNPTKFAKI